MFGIAFCLVFGLWFVWDSWPRGQFAPAHPGPARPEVERETVDLRGRRT